MPKISVRTLLLLALAVLCALPAIGNFMAHQRSGWAPIAWHYGSGSSTMDQQLQAETRANPNLPGQLLYVSAPGLGLDGAYAAGQDMAPTDAVRVASNTKTFVAAAAIILIEQGKLQLEAPIAGSLSLDVRKTLEAHGYDIQTITLRNLLMHRSGIPDFASTRIFRLLTFTPQVLKQSVHWTANQQIWIAAQFGKRAAPNAAFDYSDTNYLIVCDMIMRANKSPNCGQALRQLIPWSQFGASQTYWEAHEPKVPNVHRAPQFMGAIEQTQFDASFDQYGGGGLVMTMRDLGRMTREVVQGGVFATRTTAELMKTQSEGRVSSGYALGIDRYDILGETCWGHGGFWSTYALHCPRLDVTMARSLGQVNAKSAAPDGLNGPAIAIIRALQAKEGLVGKAVGP